MTLKKLLFYIVLIFIGIIVFFFLYFFFGSLNRFTSLKDKFPYNEIVDREMKTEVVSYIFLNEENNVIKNPYRLQVDLERMHTDHLKLYTIPIGTLLSINDATRAKRSISGGTSNLVLGTVFVTELNKKVAFELHWGENPTYGLYDHDENYDIYKQAPWQKEALPYKYFWDGSTAPHDWSTWDKIPE